MSTVKTSDIETYCERQGESPPVVFAHDAIVDHSQWDPQYDALSDDCETIAYDVRSRGRTGGSPRGRCSTDRFTDDLLA